ncbi:6-pyruvoyl trahydropterin synthase family protein [Micromonospora sp. NBC_01813]|uniref:6-pyruvoyl trahydropterin synthase family protein n=1 Tax=Micromonospora sp. NBC_01813 TaxID=2975988 RepID=UPI002DDA9C92|nr:6-pyruvoyl tetrahydropterin synthase family protein [Micromonospora sp. NBC_01813]WSA06854.1 6-pyruvoyl tetrahydropterin synthase family protein [Micromonospora sp. NBC_01813]
MSYVIAKGFSFSASHQLPGLPDGHQCGRLHGHNYTVEVVFGADELVDPGFVTDFGNLAPLKAYLSTNFDHRHLNDVLQEPPTSEHLAAHLADWVVENLEPSLTGHLIRVRVSETESTWAEYTPDRLR